MAIIHLKEGLAKFGYEPDMDKKSLINLCLVMATTQ
jgi:hypothetical protein